MCNGITISVTEQHNFPLLAYMNNVNTVMSTQQILLWERKSIKKTQLPSIVCMRVILAAVFAHICTNVLALTALHDLKP